MPPGTNIENDIFEYTYYTILIILIKIDLALT